MWFKYFDYFCAKLYLPKIKEDMLLWSMIGYMCGNEINSKVYNFE